MSYHYTTLCAVLSFTHRFESWTRKEFAAGTGLDRKTAEAVVKALHLRKVVHISGWLDDIAGRQSIGVYSMGNRPDAIKRSRLTGSQRTKAYRERTKARAAGALALAMAAMTRQTEAEEV